MKAVCNDNSISVPEALKHLTEIIMKQFKENMKYMGKDLEEEEAMRSEMEEIIKRILK